MKINERSQLALRILLEPEGALMALRIMLKGGEQNVEAMNARIAEIDAELNARGVQEERVQLDGSIGSLKVVAEDEYPSTEGLPRKQAYDVLRRWILPADARWFLIQPSALEAAKRVRVSENYTARSLKDIRIGSYCYMLGPDAFTVFRVDVGGLNGSYYDSQSGCFFRYGADLEEGGIGKATPLWEREYTQLVQLLTYIELADTEVTVIEPNGTNGKTRAEGKLKNDSDLRVHVVDSSWNQIIIRDKDFLVRGHFRLQPCGPEFRDRKLIWIDSFSKHGYKRSAPVTIIRT